LGVVLDNKASCNLHIKPVELFQGLGITFTINSLIAVYYSRVNSHLQNATTSWGSASPDLLKPIKTMQNKVIRLSTFSS